MNIGGYVGKYYLIDFTSTLGLNVISIQIDEFSFVGIINDVPPS